jgi:hypothetical protein
MIENIGAGEGNRTLVISLEGIRRSCNIKAYSDRSVPFAPLRRNTKFALSERIQLHDWPEFRAGRSRATSCVSSPPSAMMIAFPQSRRVHLVEKTAVRVARC